MNCIRAAYVRDTTRPSLYFCNIWSGTRGITRCLSNSFLCSCYFVYTRLLLQSKRYLCYIITSLPPHLCYIITPLPPHLCYIITPLPTHHSLRPPPPCQGASHPFVVITLEFMDRFSLREVYAPASSSTAKM